MPRLARFVRVDALFPSTTQNSIVDLLWLRHRVVAGNTGVGQLDPSTRRQLLELLGDERVDAD
jgi:hypothetical protein